MLERLSIKNIALIDCAEINFSKGLNVLSGETGAGKSVILDSLNFVLGAKADKSLIRSGQNEAKVSAVFSVENLGEIKSLFDEMDIEYEDEIIISRKLTIDGKSSIKLNGNSVTATMLRKVSSRLVDVHGQSEHYELLSAVNQLKLIDKIGSEQILPLKAQLKNKFALYKDIKSNLDQLGGDESQRLYRLDILDFQINEIENSDLHEGEEETLLSNKARLQNQEKILSALNSVVDGLDGEGGVSDVLLNVIRSIGTVSGVDAKYLDIYQRLESVSSEIDDIIDLSNSLLDDVSECDLNLDMIEERLDLIRNLKKKYGNSIEDIFNYLDSAKQEREQLLNYEKNAEELLNKKCILEKEIYQLYIDISKQRKDISKNFSFEVKDELRELGMPYANFEINFNQEPSFNECKFDSENGFDFITFVFSANKGEPLKSLSDIISGGEMSRFMLAIKARSAKFNDINTFIFDEIDVGISGNIALVVAKKFACISRNVQIVAITHLPQIASMADNNLYIEKNVLNDATLTSIYSLDIGGKIAEITRLVGGTESSSGKKLAEELIMSADNFKKSI